MNNNNNECSICLDLIDYEKDIIEILKCNHFYHKICINKWYNNKKNTCPNCRLSQYILEIEDIEDIEDISRYNICKKECINLLIENFIVIILIILVLLLVIIF